MKTLTVIFSPSLLPDIVYIAVLNQAHLPLCKLFLTHHKNVLCEKPLGLNKNQSRQIIQLAKDNNVFFMEVNMEANNALILGVFQNILYLAREFIMCAILALTPLTVQWCNQTGAGRGSDPPAHRNSRPLPLPNHSYCGLKCKK